MNTSIVAVIMNLCKAVDMDPEQYLGKVDVSGVKKSIYENLCK